MNGSISSETGSKSDKLITEFSKETGYDLSQYNHLDKAGLTSRQNGYVGGYIGGTMTKRLVEMAEEQLAESDPKQSGKPE